MASQSLASILEDMEIDDIVGPPVYSLDSDVLAAVFTFNADIFADDEDALKITRLSSQVCRYWRRIILNSPCLWGMLLDFDKTPHYSNLWREEILRRSGDSLLTIKGLRSFFWHPNGVPLQFLFTLLTDHWIRIEKIALRTSLNVDAATWKNIFRPTPHLRSFYLGFEGIRGDGYDELFAQPLFDTNAPLLHHFDLQGINFNTAAVRPWISQVRSLHLGWPLSPSTLFRILQMTTRLELLHYFDGNRQNTNQVMPMPQIALMSLKRIELVVDLINCLTFLTYVTVPRNCSLEFCSTTLDVDDLAPNAPGFKPLVARLAQHAHQLFSCHPPFAIKVEFLADATFQDSWDDARSPNRKFRFRIPMFSNKVDNISFILDKFSFSSPCFDSVRNLYFIAPIAAEVNLEILHFFALFPAVELLYTDGTTLEVIMSNGGQEEPLHIFPSLKILKIDTKNLYRKPEEELPSVVEYMRFRKRNGYPDVMLDLVL